MNNIKFVPKALLIFIFIYFLFILTISILITLEFKSNSLFDFLSHPISGGSASVFTLLFGIFPILAILIPQILDNSERAMFVIRVPQKSKLFNEHFVFLLIISTFFTLSIIFSGILASYFITGQVQNLWQTEEGTVFFYLENKSVFSLYKPYLTSFKVWSYILLSRFLIILLLAQLLVFLKLVLKRNIIVIFISLLLFGMERLFIHRFSLIMGHVDISIETWISPEDQYFNLLYFIFWIVLLFFICQRLYKKKEFYK